jgi:hypothetical protein
MVFSSIYNIITLALGVVFSLAIGYAITKYYIPYFFPNVDSYQKTSYLISNNKSNKVNKLLVKGILPLSNPEIFFNTTNIFSFHYTKIPNSINQDNGAEYSYSFWFNKKASPEYKNRIILMKGHKNTDTFQPIIKFGDNSDELNILFNTNKQTHNQISLNISNYSTEHTWMFISITFQDNNNPYTLNRSLYDDSIFPNGVKVQAFVNGNLEFSGQPIKNDYLIINNSPLYILPKNDNQSYYNLRGLIADIYYHNYALSLQEHMDLYKKKPNTKDFKTIVESKQSPTSLQNDNYHTRRLNIMNKIQ